MSSAGTGTRSSGRKLVVPRQLGPYRVLGRLGKGGMNTVLRARHVVLEREVALKMLPPDVRKPSTIHRFEAEARAGAAISHPHVNTCFDAGSDRGWRYVALELVAGGDLQQELERRNGRLPERLAMAFIRDVARGLEAVHRAGLLHRDIKPANILLGRDLRPQLADFGVAIGIDEQREGIAVGSPAYMAPEALRRQTLDQGADIYGLGVALFELATGTLPFRRSTEEIESGRLGLLYAPSCRIRRRSLSVELDRLLQRALAPEPRDRFPSAAAFAEALEESLRGDFDQTPSRPRLAAAAPAGSIDLPCELMLAPF